METCLVNIIMTIIFSYCTLFLSRYRLKRRTKLSSLIIQQVFFVSSYRCQLIEIFIISPRYKRKRSSNETNSNNNMSLVRSYLLKCSFHGLRFLAEKERHWSERIFWVICVCVSWVASGDFKSF